MDSSKFLIIFGVSLISYFVFDFVLSNILLYVMGGIVGNTLEEGLNAVGLKASIELVCLTWITLLLSVVMLYYKIYNKIMKFIFVILIFLLLYVIDTYFGEVLDNLTKDSKNVLVVNNIIIAFLILVKSVLLSIIVYFDMNRN